MKSYIKYLCFIVLAWAIHGGHVCAQVRYHSPQDSARVVALINNAKEGGDLMGNRIVAAAKSLKGTPFAPAADNDSVGTMMVRLDSLSQREFIYLVMAAAKSSVLTNPSLRDFEANLENISRKKGKDAGFPSQFFYAADWIVDNVFRGNLKEMTEYVDGGSYKTKTLDYVSHHPELFPAMADPDVADKIRVEEFGYRSHKIPHLKKQSISNKMIRDLLKEGDIIIMNPNDTDFDIYDIGFVTFIDGEPTLIHIAKESEVVEIDSVPLSRLFKIHSQFFYGYRWLRPAD